MCNSLHKMPKRFIKIKKKVACAAGKINQAIIFLFLNYFHVYIST